MRVVADLGGGGSLCRMLGEIFEIFEGEDVIGSEETYLPIP